MAKTARAFATFCILGLLGGLLGVLGGLPVGSGGVKGPKSPPAGSVAPQSARSCATVVNNGPGKRAYEGLWLEYFGPQIAPVEGDKRRR